MIDDILEDVLDGNEPLTSNETRVVISSMVGGSLDLAKAKTVELDLFAVDLEPSAHLVSRLQALHCFPRSLELNQCLNFSLPHLQPLCSARHWPLQSLNISECLFELDSFTLLTSSLAHFPLLEALTLSNCQLTSEMADMLNNALFSSTSTSPTSSTSSSFSITPSSSSRALLYLDLQHNPDMGTLALSQLLVGSIFSLRKLVLSGCGVMPDALLPMIQALHTSRSSPLCLKELYLDQNSDLTLRFLSQLIVPQLPLELLQIAWCALDEEADEREEEESEQAEEDRKNNLIYREIADRLLAHPSLEIIDFGGHFPRVDPSTVTAMVEAFERNRWNNRARSSLSMQIARKLYENDVDPSILPTDSRIFYQRVAVPRLQLEGEYQSSDSDSDSDE